MMKFVLKLLKHWNNIKEYTISAEEEKQFLENFKEGYIGKSKKVRNIHRIAIDRKLQATNDRVNNLYTKLSIIVAIIVMIITEILKNLKEDSPFCLILNDLHMITRCMSIWNFYVDVVFVVLLYYICKLISVIYLALLGQCYSYSSYKDLKKLKEYKQTRDFDTWQVYFDWQSSMKRAESLNVYLALLLKNSIIVVVFFLLYTILRFM